MNGKKAKALRRIRWTGTPNGRPETIKQLKRRFKCGVPLGLYGYYPRKGRNWRGLIA